MSQNKINVRKGLIWGTCGKVFNALFKFISVPLLLTHFGEEKYGLIALALSINIYLKIMELGFNTGNIRFISHWLVEGQKDKIIKLVQSSILFYGLIGIVNIITFTVLYFFCQSIFNLDVESTLIFKRLIIILGIIGFISWIYTITIHILSAYEYIGFNEKLNLLSNVFVFAGVLVTIYLSLSIETYFILYGIALLAPIPFRILKIRKLEPEIIFFPKFDKPVFNEVFRYSIGIFAMGFFQMSVQNLRPIILGIKSSLEAVTQFKIIEQVVMVILILTGSFMSVLLPFATKFKSDNNIFAQKRLAHDVTRYLSVFLVLLVFGLISISAPLLEVYVGAEYRHLSLWLNIWALTLLGNHNGALSALVLAGSNIKSLTYFTIISSTSVLILTWFAASFFGIGGVIVCFLIYVFLQLMFYYIYYIPKVMHFNSVQILVNSFLYPLGIGVFSYSIAQFIMFNFEVLNNYWVILLQGGIFTMIYLFLTSFTTLKPKEIKGLLS